MSGFPKKNTETAFDILTNWVSISLALIFALPSLGLFLGIYFMTGNLILGAVLGFGIHFVIFAFSSRISQYLSKIRN